MGSDEDIGNKLTIQPQNLVVLGPVNLQWEGYTY